MSRYKSIDARNGIIGAVDLHQAPCVEDDVSAEEQGTKRRVNQPSPNAEKCGKEAPEDHTKEPHGEAGSHPREVLARFHRIGCETAEERQGQCSRLDNESAKPGFGVCCANKAKLQGHENGESREELVVQWVDAPH